MAIDFTSGFMPNIKFKGTRDTELFLNQHSMVSFFHARRGTVYGFVTSEDGSMIFAFNEFFYNSLMVQEVSIYEAIPKLIPDGMRYNKELHKLVPDVISASDEYCSGIKVELEKDINITLEDRQILDELKKSGKSYLEIINVIKNIDTFTPSYYGAKCKCGEKLDAYAICDKYSNEHKPSAWHHAVKKLIRAGDGHKPLLKDIDEVIDSLKRWKEQLNAK